MTGAFTTTTRISFIYIYQRISLNMALAFLKQLKWTDRAENLGGTCHICLYSWAFK
uniref:Uncharacterized protein n=1 Tax=Rhizophora mucronata TaxID=61149 RepID=A0A2P2IU20_RHIMU